MRPCTELKPCAPLTKYAVVFDEQPMPDSFATSAPRRPQERLGDRGGDRVVAAAGAKRRHRALVVAAREARALFFGSSGWVTFGFGMKLIGPLTTPRPHCGRRLAETSAIMPHRR